MSILIVFLSLLFWGWVLGPIGAILSIPLTLTFKRLINILRHDNRLNATSLLADADNEVSEE
jgi:predicted PurR-regulated permease PerM